MFKDNCRLMIRKKKKPQLQDIGGLWSAHPVGTGVGQEHPALAWWAWGLALWLSVLRVKDPVPQRGYLHGHP